MADKMTDTEIIEQFFKARWWSERTDGFNLGWYKPDDSYFGTPLPKILTDFPAFKGHILEVMEAEKYFLVVYHSLNEVHWSKGAGQSVKEITKDNNILHAAVIAATRYFESKEK